MNEFDSCVHRIIKQIYPVLAYEYEMGLRESRGESSGIYSFQFLRSLHENSMDNIHKILRQTESDDVCKKEFDKAEKKILLEFFTYLNEKKSQLTQLWLNLQHYMHYIYRTLTSTNPQIYNREISECFLEEMKKLVKILSEADEIQLYLRIFSTLREYVTFAFWQYSKPTNKGPAVERLYRCYQTFLIASKNIHPVFTELEELLKDKCNMTWMDYNKFVFFNYFYEAINAEILMKANQDEDLGVPEEYNAMILDFGELNTLWQTLKTLRGINEKMDKEMSEDHKQILNKNFWICRNKTEEKQGVHKLAAELIILASERRVRGSEPLLDKNGQCLCEDCLIFKLSNIVENGDAPIYSRLSPCRYCLQAIELNKLHDHVVDHIRCRDRLKCAPKNDTKGINCNNGDNVDDLKKTTETENNGDKSENKVSQCLINLLKKTKSAAAGRTNAKTDHLNNRPDEKKVEFNHAHEIKENCWTPTVRSEATNKNSSSCYHSCKHEEELKAELKKLHGVCDHHKDSKKCDCTYCEVFGSTVTSHLHKTNETRNRLRIRLNQRKQKLVSKNPLIDKTNKIPPKTTIPIKSNPLTTSTKDESLVNVQNPPVKNPTLVKNISKPLTESIIRDIKITSETLKGRIAPKTNDSTKLNDIHGLVDYIEGNSGSDKMAIAEKKAAKKARQRQKKEEERKQIEEEEKLRDEEKKREEAKSRLLKQLVQEKDSTNEGIKKNPKKQKNKEKGIAVSDIFSNESCKTNLIEETIPAMVTIKRSIDNGDNRPTVTITLRGSTPDQDKLLYTLVNGHNDQKNNKEINAPNKTKKNKKNSNLVEHKTEHFVKLQVLQKDVGKGSNGKLNNSIEKEVKVSFTVNNGSNNNTQKNPSIDAERNGRKQVKVENKKNKELDLPFLRLPPGITITKVDGPLSNKNPKNPVTESNNVGNAVPMNNKSGVIVVDTEKLIQTNGDNSSITKKSKKKKNKKQQSTNVKSAANSQPSMVTLKNPIFHTLTETVTREPSLPVEIAGASCGQASIFKNENGMVTIRSSRLQHSFNNGVPMHNLLSELKPVMGGEVASPISNSCTILSESNTSCFNAQEILSGLPGIEITKVDKKNLKSDHDSKISQIAQVSIIPTNGDKSTLDKDDWLYDNIFTPKDVLEDDLDAEERELEAFKRFCQQSIPPKQKEKVAHLNVKDIVLKKKNDVSSV